jgi:hypothetical protein
MPPYSKLYDKAYVCQDEHTKTNSAPPVLPCVHSIKENFVWLTSKIVTYIKNAH